MVIKRLHLKLSPVVITILFVLLADLASGSPQKRDTTRNPYHLNLVSDIADYRKQVNADPKLELVNLENVIPGIVTDIRYATDNNFTGEVIYEMARAYARHPVAVALKLVQDSLAVHGLGLKIYDAYRPYAATLRFFEVYPDTNFVANPRFGSRHNRGCAVDITLVDLTTKQEIAMPTVFDDFTEKAHPQYTNLPQEVIANRTFLFSVMKHFGFTFYHSEWWHFDFDGWEKYPLMDLTFDQLEH